ncbi:MAG TPA: Ryanodine receptor Ryr [Candidatus Avirikenella pullistercoris]|nr:Ryanodine receptor Ryr [Candidatus Avirikenella pullistercoris]
MNNIEYIPKPVDVSEIELPETLGVLMEALAKNVHEEWAQGRIREGWRYGKERNDRLKQHPGLVPYEELSESEREYDRNTAVATLKFILKNGFEIRKKE